MKSSVRFLFFIVVVASCSPVASVAQKWQIEWVDNIAQMNMEQRYKIGPDSLLVTGVSDYGKTRVKYLERKLLPEERSTLLGFLSGFRTDSLATSYFHEYSGFSVISSESYPRSIDLTIRKNGKVTQSKATNCWVGLFDQVARAINPVLPVEVQVKYQAESFEVIK